MRHVARDSQSTQLRLVEGRAVRAHSSRKSARRNPIPVQSKRTILYIGEET